MNRPKIVLGCNIKSRSTPQLFEHQVKAGLMQWDSIIEDKRNLQGERGTGKQGESSSNAMSLTLITLITLFLAASIRWGEKGGTVSDPFPRSIPALFVLFLFTFAVALIAWPATSLQGQGMASS
jgi:hypothetical protein